MPKSQLLLSLAPSSRGRLLITTGGCVFTLGAGLCLARAAKADPAITPAAQTQATQLQPPTVVAQHQADYPPAALARRLVGDVAVVVEIDAGGKVTDASVGRRVAPELDAAAIAAATQWRFEPAQRDGVPIPSRVQLIFHFEPPALAAPVKPESATPVNPAMAAIGAAAPIPAASEVPAALDVSVAGRRPPLSHGASDFQIRIAQLAEVPRANASDLLKLAPGILLTNEGGQGHAEQVFMRGFDAREGQDIEFTVSGVPINESGNLHGNGYADTHFMIPELVEGLRVVEGPFDPRQGNYAVAGSADYELGLSERGLSLRYTSGSFGTERVLALWGPRGESTHTFGAAEVSKTDGFGQNRDAQAASAMSQYEGWIGTNGSYRLTAQGYATHFHSAGVIREDDYQSGRIGFYDSYDLSSFARERVPEGGDAARFSIAGDVEKRSGDATFGMQVYAIKRDMRLLENFTGFLLDVQEPLQSVHGQRGDMLDLNVHELTVGTRGWSRVVGIWAGQRQELELGYFARGDQALGTQERVEASTGVPYKTDANLDAQIGDIALYGDANLRLGRWVSLRGGGRAELLTYDVHDNCAAQTVAHPAPSNLPIDQSCLSEQDYGRPREPDQVTSTSGVALLPRATLIVGPLRGVSLSLSWGKGVRSVDPSYVISDVSAAFASVTAYEAGVAFTSHLRNRARDTTPGSARDLTRDITIVARSVFFQTVVDKDLIFDQTQGRNVIGVGTTRTGWLGAARLSGSFFDQSANLTLVRATYNDNGATVAYVPSVVLRSDTALFHNFSRWIFGRPLRVSLGAGVTYVGPRPLPYGETSGSLFTIDASTSATWGPFQLRILSTNLLNTQQRLGEYNYASDFHSQPQPTLVPDRTFTAAPPRGVFMTLGVTLQGV